MKSALIAISLAVIAALSISWQEPEIGKAPWLRGGSLVAVTEITLDSPAIRVRNVDFLSAPDKPFNIHIDEGIVAEDLERDDPIWLGLGLLLTLLELPDTSGEPALEARQTIELAAERYPTLENPRAADLDDFLDQAARALAFQKLAESADLISHQVIMDSPGPGAREERYVFRLR